MITPLLDYDKAAQLLGCSRALISNLASAAEYAAEVRAGKRRVEDVPPRLRQHLNSGFPRPIIVGERLKRIRPDELRRWLARS